jgi:hypothetical protein
MKCVHKRIQLFTTPSNGTSADADWRERDRSKGVDRDARRGGKSGGKWGEIEKKQTKNNNMRK